MNHYAGRKIVYIDPTQITNDQKQHFKSFATRQSGPVAIDGRFRGVIGCAGSTAGHEDCGFALAEIRNTPDEAMQDARSLFYLLEEEFGTGQSVREVPSVYYRGFNYTKAPAYGNNGRYRDNFTIHGPRDPASPQKLFTLYTRTYEDADDFAFVEDAIASIEVKATEWIDHHLRS